MRSILFATVLIIGTRVAALAQTETMPVVLENKYGEAEEYNVLKADKRIRQGPYAKYRVVLGPRHEISMRETGSYEQGQKEGVWRTYFDGRLFNRLSSKGNYHAGLPDGQWIYYHRPSKDAPTRPIYTGKNTKKSLTIDLDDSLAVMRAKGLCFRGAKIGLWKYYDEHGVLIQAFNESTRKLMYWQQPTGQPANAETLMANHPLLYVGGKTRLIYDLLENINVRALIGTGETVMKTGQVSSTELVISVDSVGHQTGVALAATAAPNPYEQFILGEISKTTTYWLPQVLNGKAVASNYRLVLMGDKPKKDEVHVSAKALGD